MAGPEKRGGWLDGMRVKYQKPDLTIRSSADFLDFFNNTLLAEARLWIGGRDAALPIEDEGDYDLALSYAEGTTAEDDEFRKEIAGEKNRASTRQQQNRLFIFAALGLGLALVIAILGAVMIYMDRQVKEEALTELNRALERLVKETGASRP